MAYILLAYNTHTKTHTGLPRENAAFQHLRELAGQLPPLGRSAPLWLTLEPTQADHSLRGSALGIVSRVFPFAAYLNQSATGPAPSPAKAKSNSRFRALILHGCSGRFSSSATPSMMDAHMASIDWPRGNRCPGRGG